MGKGKLKNLKNGRKMYDDDPGCKYLVIENPWPRCTMVSRRTSFWFDHVGAWLWYASNKTLLPDEILHIGTKIEVIVKFSDKLDVSCLLGEHDWSRITLKESVPPEGSFSYIFEYDYGMKGHPDDHQWMGHPLPDLSKDIALQNNALPIRQPYPPPAWADCRNWKRSCKDLALPMPTNKPKPTPATPQILQPVASAREQQAVPSSIFAGLAEHIPDRPQQDAPSTQEVPVNNSSQPRPGQLYTKKLDPEDEETLAARLLKSEPQDQKVPLVKLEAGLVKSESVNDPSPEAQAQYEAWRRSIGAQSAEIKQEPGRKVVSAVKAEPGVAKPDTSEKDASTEMQKLYAEYERTRSAGAPSSELSVNREMDGVKPKQETQTLPSSFEGPKVKPEENDPTIKPEPRGSVVDPRRRGNTTAAADLSRTTGVKRESNANDPGQGQEYVKRVKIE